jgi:hypothetical protein
VLADVCCWLWQLLRRLSLLHLLLLLLDVSWCLLMF